MNGGPGGLGRPHDLAAKAQKWKSMVGKNGQEVAEQIRQEDGIRMVQVRSLFHECVQNILE